MKKSITSMAFLLVASAFFRADGAYLRASGYFLYGDWSAGSSYISGIPASGFFSNVTLTATPNPGYKPTAWYYRLSPLSGRKENLSDWTLLADEGGAHDQCIAGYPSPFSGNNSYYVALDLSYVSYGILFDNAGGSGSTPSLTGLVVTNDVVLPVPRRTGYSFAKWRDSAGKSFQAGIAIQPAIDLGIGNADTNFTLTAQWQPNTYSVAYELAGGVAGALHPVSASYDTVFEVSAPTRTGYKFKGWTFANINTSTARYGTTSNPTSSMSAGVPYPSGGGNIWLKNLTPTGSATVTLTATWEPVKCNINYNFGGGTAGTGTPTSLDYGIWKEIPPPMRNGYTFAGWRISGQDTSTAMYSVEVGHGQGMNADPFNITPVNAGYSAVCNLTPVNGGVVSFTALWAAKTYGMSYNLDGGTAGASAPASAAYGDAFMVSAPTRTGYDFKGWTFANIDTSTARYGTTSNPTSSMSAGVPYPSGGGNIWLKNLTPTGSATVTLTATWQISTYTVHLETSGVTQPYTDTLTVTYGQPLPSVSIVPVYASGAEFYGFYTEPDGQGVQYWDNEGRPNSAIAVWTNDVDNMTFYAYKGGSQRVVHFNGNGGSPSQTTEKRVEGSAYGETPAVSWAGNKYSFTGWFTEQTGGDEVLGTTLVPAGSGDINLYAHWAVSNYYVRFDGNGATEGAMDLQRIDFDAGAALSSNKYSKVGMHFTGWSSDGSTKVAYADHAVVTNLSMTAGETNVLTAVWSTNTYYVVFDANGGSGTMATLTNSYGKATVYPQNGFTRNGFWNFSCWSNTVNGATAAPGDDLLNLADKDGETVVVKAVWSTTLTEYSQAMHCDNLQWNAKDLDYPFGNDWKIERGQSLGYEQSGSMVSQKGRLTAGQTWFRSIQANVNTNGTFRFKCRTESGAAGTLRVWMDHYGVDTYDSDRVIKRHEISISELQGGIWQEVSFSVLDDGNGFPIYVNLSNSTVGEKMCIDHMEWIPEGSDVPVEPGPGDEREFSSLAFSGDSLFLSFPDADERFSYVLRGTNDLISPMPWPALFSTNGTGSITIETKILPGEPCMFYYLETTAK